MPSYGVRLRTADQPDLRVVVDDGQAYPGLGRG